jgi:UDP-N-acetylglucosamine 4-epimerase
MRSLTKFASASWPQDWSVKWLVTGAAGFIGSHLVEHLLRLKQSVVGLDNLATGFERNLHAVQESVGEEAWRHFTWLKGDLLDSSACREACSEARVVLHQAALGSVPRSLDNPLATHAANVTGFLNLLDAARRAGIKRIVYASSSSVYGDSSALPKRENELGSVLSPYAASKRCGEIYAGAFGKCFGLEMIGLRYFNVFGPRQNLQGPYAAVIPKWIGEVRQGRPIVVFGDGETSRDFCYVANVVQANLKAATIDRAAAYDRIYNIACHAQISLKEVAALLLKFLAKKYPSSAPVPVLFKDFRPGDMRHSLADITAAADLLDYHPSHSFEEGLSETVDWFCRQPDLVAR